LLLILFNLFWSGKHIEQKGEVCQRLDCLQQIQAFVLVGKNDENLQGALKVSTVVESYLQDPPRNESSPLPWCVDRVGDIESSKSTVSFAASITALTKTATLAAVVTLSHAKPPPNQVLTSVNQIVQLWDEVSLPNNEALLEPNDASKSQNKVLVAGDVAYSQVTETAINNSSSMEDPLKRVNALKKQPYNYHMKPRPSSGLI